MTTPFRLTLAGPVQAGPWFAYRMRWKRRRFLFRCWRKRDQIKPVIDRTSAITDHATLCFMTVRNEMLRLPFFFDHYRALGVTHFLIVDNASDDGTAAYLADQPDVSLWHTDHSYRLSRFGTDWLGWLQMCHGHGHWCLTVDADEILVYPDMQNQSLPQFTAGLEKNGQLAFGALMLDMYPKGPLSSQDYAPGTDPMAILDWFDPADYRVTPHSVYGNPWIQGGPRARNFFADTPRRAPTLNKYPLVKWSKRYVYVNSTHQILPRRLHDFYDPIGMNHASGVLLHTKFLPNIADKTEEELTRQQHFQNSDLYQDYYQALLAHPQLWDETVSVRYEGPDQLERLGLMARA